MNAPTPLSPEALVSTRYVIPYAIWLSVNQRSAGSGSSNSRVK